MIARIFLALGLLAAPISGAAQAQDMTTPEGAAMVHQAIANQILSFQEMDDQDVIYFTAILAWRCGLSEIRYGLNDDPPETLFPMEDCYRQYRDPNTMNPDLGSPISISVPKGSVTKVRLRLIYEDGKTAEFLSERAANLIR